MKRIIICLILLSVITGTLFAQGSLRIFNFNTRMSGEMTGYSVLAFAELIRRYNPDVILLQEVDFYTTRNGQKDFVTELGAELGMFPVFGKAIAYQGGEYGVGIISRYPLEKISNQSLSGDATQMKEIRTLLYVDITLPASGQKFRIGTTHLDHSTAGVRTSMAGQMNAYVGSTLPTIITGDFNAAPSEEVIRTTMASWQRICDNMPTFPATPTSKIDYIFAKPAGAWTVKSYQVVKQTGISDHCALVAEIEYK